MTALAKPGAAGSCPISSRVRVRQRGLGEELDEHSYGRGDQRIWIPARSRVPSDPGASPFTGSIKRSVSPVAHDRARPASPWLSPCNYEPRSRRPVISFVVIRM